jgi:GAF domain-containing protein
MTLDADTPWLKEALARALLPAPALVFVCEAATRSRLYASSAAESLVALGEAAKFGAARAHPEDRARLVEAYDAATREQAARELTYRAWTPDGRQLWLRDHVQPVPSPEGLRLLTWTTDLTEQVVASDRVLAQDLVTTAIAESVDLAEAAPRILDGLCRTLRWHVGALWVEQPKVNLLECLEVWAASTRAWPGFITSTREARFPPGVGLPGRVWASGEPAFIPDVTRDINFPRLKIAGDEGLRSAVGIPITTSRRICGVLELFSAEQNLLDDASLSMLASLGAQIGQFIEKTRAEEARELLMEQANAARNEARHARAHLDMLARVGALFGGEDAEPLLSQLVECVVPLFADCCAVDLRQPDGALRRVAFALDAPDAPSILPKLRGLQEARLPAFPSPERGAEDTGSVVAPEVTETLLRAVAVDAQHLEAMHALQPCSFILTPLEGRAGRLLFISTARSGRRYGPADLSIAEDIARRVGRALELSRLRRLDAERRA